MLGNDLSKRIYGLDIMRCIAIMAVLLHHTYHFVGINDFVRSIHSIIFVDGVDLFFVLSGFLIGQILLKTISKQGVGLKDLLHFWTNRWFRTLPLYYSILLANILIVGISSAGPKLWQYFIFLQNLFWRIPDFYAESWSLAVEEWFYLIFAFTLFFFKIVLKRKTSLSILYSVILISILAFAARSYKLSAIDIRHFSDYFWSMAINFNVLTRIDSILLGVLGAYLLAKFPKQWYKYKYISLAIGIALLFINREMSIYAWQHHDHPLWTIYLAIFHTFVRCIPYLLVLPFLSSIRSGSGIIHKTISYISIISYSLYLVHLSLVLPLLNRFKEQIDNDVVIIVLYFVLTFVIATITYRIIEQPGLKLRTGFNNKFFPKR